MSFFLDGFFYKDPPTPEEMARAKELARFVRRHELSEQMMTEKGKSIARRIYAILREKSDDENTQTVEHNSSGN